MPAPHDYLIVGAGLFGATFARRMADAGKRCLVIDKRAHIGGNCHTRVVEGIHVHAYGPHIFHCNDERIWAFVNRFARFNGFRNAPIAIARGKAYSLPFSMYTFHQLWGVTTPAEALQRIAAQRLDLQGREPANLEEHALALVGRDVYETLVRHYTAKQWMREPRELPAAILKRLPFRLTWDNSYFDDRFQGIPIGGYTRMVERMLGGIEVRTGVDYLAERDALDALATTTVYTGCIDEFFDYADGELQYRTLRFESDIHPCSNWQGNAVVNYSDPEVPWTRSIEHRHFDNDPSVPVTCVTREIPDRWARGKIPFYPVGDAANLARHERYLARAAALPRHVFGGRLAQYRYYDMHQVIGSALSVAQRVLREGGARAQGTHAVASTADSR
ncbi:MAG: UDP-galactopyranose mutase [Pseudomonadota bacterium]